jgi:hypothetical protein
MVAVAVFAILFVDLRVNYSWWEIKPLLYLVFIPLVSAAIAMREPRRAALLLATAMNISLLVAWYELRRPFEGVVVGGEYPEFVRDLLVYGWDRELYRHADFAARWFYSKGTLTDLLCLTAPLFMLSVMLAGAVSVRTRVLGALGLNLLAIYGWANSKRFGGSGDAFEWLKNPAPFSGDKTPVHLAEYWLYKGGTLSTLLRAVGAVRSLEFLALAVVIVCVSAVGWRAVHTQARNRKP